MKKSLLLLLTVFMINLCYAQDDIDIKFNQDKEVLLNGTVIGNTTDFETIKSMLGTPIISKEFPSGKAVYHYEDLGIMVQIYQDKLVFFGVNFNWDGDETFPETTFTGSFEIDGTTIDETSDSSILEEIKVVEIKCMIPSMCMTNPNKEKTNILLGFEENIITQVGFEFH